MDSEEDDYGTSDSEQAYSEEEREILAELRKERKQRAEEQKNQKQDVLSFSDSDDDDEDDVAELMRDSDIEGADDDGDLPDTMDWGSNKKAYYNTDFVDPDYNSYNAEEEDMAKAEEEEAKRIQLRLAKQLSEADFQLDDDDGDNDDDVRTSTKAAQKSQKNAAKSIKVTTDLTGLNERELLQLLQKDSPEFKGLTLDFQRHLTEVQQLTAPVVNYVRNHQVPMVPALQFASMYQNVLLTYCSNLSFYLLLKAKRSNVKFHPVVKRLVQLKQLRDQLATRYENFVRPQLEALLERIRDGDAFTVLDVAQRKAKLQILNKYNQHENGVAAAKPKSNGDVEQDKHTDDEDEDDDDDDDDERALKKLAEQDADADAADGDEAEDEQARRGITYQISKNRGLTPHRKKELRNPRVKHRGKYRKALIRRKGAVRSVRKELQRYGGENSGIKAGVTKSVKFKS